MTETIALVSMAAGVGGAVGILIGVGITLYFTRPDPLDKWRPEEDR